MDPKLEKDLGLDRSIPDVFDVDDSVVEARFQQYSAIDPFPGIRPALLNSADLLDYASATGMIHPFRLDMANLDDNLKPASYGVPLLGTYVYWEYEPSAAAGLQAGDGPRYAKRVSTLKEGEELRLLPNTITYVTLEPYFRLPRYIAARFNLAIRDIYRGILVGTGPLVDPGFEGRLSIPLHNLTSNEYALLGGETLVWMEFTKLSAASGGWRGAAPPERPTRGGFYQPFPARKKREGIEYYLRKAHPSPIVSSIPSAVGRSQAAAERAQGAAEASRSTVRRITLGGALVTLLTVAALLIPTWALIHDANGRADAAADRMARLEQQLASETARLEAQLETEQLRNEQQTAEIARLRARLPRS